MSPFRTMTTFALSLILCWVFSQLAYCQSGIVVKFSDRAPRKTKVQSPARVVLSANWVQESDFAPKKENATKKDPSNEEPSKPSNDDKPLDQMSGDEAKDDTDPAQSRDSDKPVDTPKFDIDEKSDPDRGKEPDSSQNADSNDSAINEYQLPVVADVHAPISIMPLAGVRQPDPSGLLLNNQSPSQSGYSNANNVGYAGVTGRMSRPKSKTWQAHNFYHRPLYFEEHNVERHGNRRPFERVASTVHFFGTIPQLPYKIGSLPPRKRIYTHGQIRPGDYSQFHIVKAPESRRGNALQTLVLLGFILP